MKWQAEKRIAEYGSPLIDVEDGGQAVIIDFYDIDADEGMWVQLRSWKNLSSRISEAEDLNAAHPDLSQFVGKKVRVTVEVIDE